MACEGPCAGAGSRGNDSQGWFSDFAQVLGVELSDVTLMNIDDLVEAITEHYENLDVETKQLLPLKRIYWPV